MQNAQDSWECSWVVKIPASPGGGAGFSPQYWKQDKQTNKCVSALVSEDGQ